MRFRVWDHRRFDRLVVERIGGLPIIVLPGVFNPRLFRTGDFLARSLGPELVPAGSLVLDMGTGSGVGAIFAAPHARRVIAVDISIQAVHCARVNVLLHRLNGQVDVLLADLFAPLAGGRFDVVLFNPPYFRGQPHGAFERALRSVDVVERFAAGLSAALTPAGKALVVLSSAVERERAVISFRRAGLKCEQIKTRDLLNERLELHAVSVPQVT
jgi:methylase of polypeptide subunit release factors